MSWQIWIVLNSIWIGIHVEVKFVVRLFFFGNFLIIYFRSFIIEDLRLSCWQCEVLIVFWCRFIRFLLVFFFHIFLYLLFQSHVFFLFLPFDLLFPSTIFIHLNSQLLLIFSLFASFPLHFFRVSYEETSSISLISSD